MKIHEIGQNHKTSYRMPISLIVTGLTMAMVNNTSTKVAINGRYEEYFGKVVEVREKDDICVIEHFDCISTHKISEITDVIS